MQLPWVCRREAPILQGIAYLVSAAQYRQAVQCVAPAKSPNAQHPARRIDKSDHDFRSLAANAPGNILVLAICAVAHSFRK